MQIGQQPKPLVTQFAARQPVNRPVQPQFAGQIKFSGGGELGGPSKPSWWGGLKNLLNNARNIFFFWSRDAKRATPQVAIANYRADLAELQQRKQSFEERVAAIEGRANRAKDKLKELEGQLPESEANLDIAIDLHDENVPALEAELEKARQIENAERREEEVQRIQDQIQAYKDEFNRANEAHEKLLDDIEEQRGELASAKQDAVDANNESIRFNQEIAELEGRIQAAIKLEKKKEDKQEQLGIVRELQALRTTTAAEGGSDLADRINATEEEFYTLDAQLKRARGENSASRASSQARAQVIQKQQERKTDDALAKAREARAKRQGGTNGGSQ